MKSISDSRQKRNFFNNEISLFWSVIICNYLCSVSANIKREKKCCYIVLNWLNSVRHHNACHSHLCHRCITGEYSSCPHIEAKQQLLLMCANKWWRIIILKAHKSSTWSTIFQYFKQCEHLNFVQYNFGATKQGENNTPQKNRKPRRFELSSNFSPR